jgi:two-component system chemotaxis response regulator CheB
MKGGAAGFVLRPETDQPLLMRPAAEEIVALIEPGAARVRPAPRALGRSGEPAARARMEPLAQPRESAPAGPARVRAALQARRPDPSPAPLGDAPGAPAPARAPRKQVLSPQVVVVASSTGGPQALIDVFRGIGPSVLPVPVLVVQHMPAAFTPILAEHLSRATAWSAREAASDECLTAGEIRIAPGGHHMVVTGAGAERRIRLTSTPPVNFCRPSADVLFTSAAEAFGRAVLAVILTGMGNDGTEGAKVIAAAGGAILAQDKATSVVWGMPGAAVNAGIVDKVVPLDGMAKAMQLAMKGVL